MKTLLTSKSQWHQGDKVDGLYCGVEFSGIINGNTRPTPDYKNVIFCVTLDNPIEVYGHLNSTIEVWTNNLYNYIYSV